MDFKQFVFWNLENVGVLLDEIVRCSLQILLGKMLGEKAQLNACKDIVVIVDKLMNTLELGPENAGANTSGGNSETMYSQHLLVVALQELGKYIHVAFL